MNKNISYVDEEGNSLDAEEIDSETMEFFDDVGRSVDMNGVLLKGRLTESQTLKVAEFLLKAGRNEELLVHCQVSVETFQESRLLWQLLGVAHGNAGNAKSARLSFLKALTLDSRNSITLANYVTACFHIGDVTSALNAISAYFQDLDLEGQKIVLETVLEGLRSKIICARDLPAVILDLL